MKSIKKGIIRKHFCWFIHVFRGQAIINGITQQGSENRLPFFKIAYENFFSALFQKLSSGILGKKKKLIF